MTSIRLILAIIAHLNLKLFQMNVKIASLNGELNEKIYMDQPIGFESKGYEQQMLPSQTFYIWYKIIVKAVVFSISIYNNLYWFSDDWRRPLRVS